MLLKTLVSVGVAALSLNGIARADLAQAIEAARKGDLNAARAAARQSSTAANDARSWHVLGVLEIALANPRAADEAFTKEIESDPKTAETTGLEEIVAPGNPLYDQLRKQKTTVALGAGKAAALNDRAAARYLLGRMAQALADADTAAVTQADWGVPWANAALILLDRNQLERAETSARKALDLGEQTARVFTTLAEIELRTGRFDRVKDDLNEALQRDPDYPYALLAQAQFLRLQGKSRESERSLSQALSHGPLVTVDSRFESAAGEGFGLAGSATNTNLRLLQHGLPSPGFGYRILGQTDRNQVEARENAYQQTDLAEATVAGRFGAFFAGYVSSAGGRPGATTPIVGIDPQPDARYTFRQTNAAWQVRKALADTTAMSVLVHYRKDDVEMRLAPSAPSFQPLRDEQWLGETRFDLEHGHGTGTSLGLAVSRTQRERNGATPIEPLEQVLPAGRTTQITSYAIHRRPLTQHIDLELGGVLGGTRSALRLQPVAQLAVKVTDTRTVRLAMTPRINDAVSDLMPVDILADPPQNNPIDRKLGSTDAFNRSPTLQGPGGRLLDFELAFGPDAEQSGVPETILFHRQMNDIETQAADPRLAPALVLTPVGTGEATGVTERIRFDLSEHFLVRLSATYQQSRSAISTPTFDAKAYPQQVPMNSDGMPNFPPFQGSARLDWVNRDWNVGFETQFIGSRPRAVSVNSGNGQVTYLSNAPAAVGLNLFFRRRAGRNLNLTAAVFNLANASFYPGYPGHTTAVFGYDYRF